MKRLSFKQTFFLLISTSTMASCIVRATNAQDRLQQLLKNRPDLAKQFLPKTVETEKTISSEKAEKVVTEQPKPVKKPAEIKPVEQPQPKPIKKPWMSDQEKKDIDTILTNLETYASRVYTRLDAFFSKANTVLYKTHVQGFRGELENLQKNLLHVFPRAESPERQKLFSTLYTLTQSFEQTQELLCKLVDRHYASSVLGVTSIANEFRKTRPSLVKQQGVVNQLVNTLRSELRAPEGREILNRINRLQPAINKVFDYGQDKSVSELYSIMKHRLKQ